MKGQIAFYFFAGFALILFVMQMATLCTFIYQSLRYKQFKSRSGAPLVGSGLLSVAVVSWTPLAIEAIAIAIAVAVRWYVKPTPISVSS